MAREIYIFLGPPGSGKGTIADLCIKELGWKQLSTGNLCRKHISEGSEIGKQIDLIIKSGKLIPDKLIFDMVKDWLLKQSEILKPIILDGFPRTVVQAKGLMDLLKNSNLNVVRFVIPDKALISRLLSRLICSNKGCQAGYSAVPGSGLEPKKDMVCNICESPLIRRGDDEIESIKKRIAIYGKHEQDLLDFFSLIGQEVKGIDADKLVSEVFEAFKKKIS